MAIVHPPKILAYELGVAAGADSNRFVPSSGQSWEVHSILVTKPATLYRDFDPAAQGTWDVRVKVDSIADSDGGEFHGYKFELDEHSGITVHNDGTESMDVVLVGVVITD